MDFLFKEVPPHIYIHLPFCAKRCHYCDFIALAAHESFIQPYHEALIKEIKLFAQKFEFSKSNPIKTIFIGGGTPSLYPIDNLEDIFQTLNQNYDLSQLLEVTIETNPVDITPTKLAAWKGLGINRLSMGVQVLDDDVLKRLNRSQKVKDVLRAIQITPNYFENISVDLILGLPGVSSEQWTSTLESVVGWPIKHISVYLLTIYDKTPMFFKLENGELGIESDEHLVNMHEVTFKFLQDFGFDRYEISNFAKNGYESRHNLAYWERCPYYGFGLSASSFDGKNRYTNQNNLEKYIQTIQLNNALPIEYFESLTSNQEVLELLMLGLRLKKGVGLQSVLYLLSDYQKNRFLNNLTQLTNESFITSDNNKLCLTAKGLLLENNVVLDLLKEVF
ncbi:MAG: hypothetical protein US49_C0006G0019 [candidate division TM6 bacterium GW2011_GWF2_37_49]|nr:MAG: hypothetical protein US49_C0006G0019 [candidate division TM6 bacterium GW2011_GWF2_37_49]